MVQRDWRDKKTTEELLEDLETAEEPELDIVDYSDDVVPFLLKYGIESGDFSIKSQQLYKLYKSYSKYPLTSRQFNTIINTHIPSFNNSKGYWHKINVNSFKISDLTHKALFKRKVDKTKSQTSMRHFDDICQRLCLKKGKRWVQGFIIHETYKKYCKYMGKRPLLGVRTFDQFLRLSFNFRRRVSDRHMWYAIDEGYKKYLTDEEIQTIKRERCRSSTSKRKPKKSKSVQGIRPDIESKD